MKEIICGNIVEYFSKINSIRPHKSAILENHFSISYNDLFELSQKACSYLKFQKLSPGDRVVFAQDHCIQSVVYLLGLIQLGCVPVMLSCASAPARIAEAHKIGVCKNFDQIALTKLQNFAPDKNYYQFDPDQEAIWFVSSGTTGNQKYIVHRHLNLANIWRLVLPSYGINEDSCILSSAKITFSYGLVNFFMSLGVGATSVLRQENFNSKTLIKTLADADVTHLFTNPTLITHLVKTHKKKLDLPRLGVIVSGSDHLPISIVHDLQKIFDGKLIDSYGMAEVMHAITSQTVNNPAPGTTGTPVPGIICQLRKNDHVVHPGEVGELWVQHPYSALCYWNNYQKTQEVFNGSWLRTGDLMRQDCQGNYVYQGRVDNLVKIRSQTVNIAQIEYILVSYPDIDDCQVVPVKNNLGELELVAFVCGQQPIESSNIKKYLAQYIDSHEIPKKIQSVEKIERTTTGKKIRHTEYRQVDH
jgi:acyl-coenzyme A synthetase/AMP-(fatty) acid ligase